MHDGDNAQQILIKAATTPARPFATVMPGTPAALCDVIDRALAFERSRRWSSAVAMREALKGASRQAFGAVPTPESTGAIVDELAEHEKTRILGPTEVSRVLELVGGARAPEGSSRKVHNAGAVTAEAVATDSVGRGTAARPRGVMAGAVVLAALGIVGVLVVAMRGAPATDSKGPGTPSRASAAAATVAASALAPASTSPWAPVAPAAPVVPVVPEETPVSSAAPRPAPAAPPVTKHTVTPSPMVAATPAPATSAPTPARPRCDPPYEFDDKGNKRWKRECL